MAPMLIGARRSPRQVAPATLAATLLTSIVGIATFERRGRIVCPDRPWSNQAKHGATWDAGSARTGISRSPRDGHAR
jgi:hypothetical protein